MRINEVTPLSDHTLKIVSDEGISGIFNIIPYLNYEAFQPLKQISECMKIYNGGYFVECECGDDLYSDTIESKLII